MSNAKKGNFFSRLIHSQLIIPLVALLFLVVVNLIAHPGFFAIQYGVDNMGYPLFTGNIITIINLGSELAILAIGMTFVTAASGGQDISVGATIAIAGSVIMRILCGPDGSATTPQAPIIVAFLAAVLVSMLCGAFNGVLVAYVKIPPMVATLILFTAGRSIAAWINNNRLPYLIDEGFDTIGGHFSWCPLPTPLFITILCIIVAVLLLKFTAIGTYIQAVGINESSSRLNGINPKVIKFVTFVFLGVCVAVCGLIKVSRNAINYSTIAKDIEMDAILAVALGGNSLGGGKFNLGASIIGAYVIEFLSITLYAFDVNAAALPAYKAAVVIILVVLSSPAVSSKLSAISKKRAVAKEAA